MNPASPTSPTSASTGADARTQAPVELSFEHGYARLQAIAERLGQAEVPVSEMCDLFAEGKGLELALTEFLDTERARVEAIERGEGLRRFRISRGDATGAGSSAPGRADDGAPPELDEIPF